MRTFVDWSIIEVEVRSLWRGFGRLQTGRHRCAQLNPRKRWLSPEQRVQLDKLVLQRIIKICASYKQPTTNDVVNNCCFGSMEIPRPGRRYSWSLIEASLRRLQANGLIQSSLGIGELGFEEYCWELMPRG